MMTDKKRLFDEIVPEETRKAIDSSFRNKFSTVPFQILFGCAPETLSYYMYQCAMVLERLLANSNNPMLISSISSPTWACELANEYETQLFKLNTKTPFERRELAVYGKLVRLVRGQPIAFGDDLTATRALFFVCVLRSRTLQAMLTLVEARSPGCVARLPHNEPLNRDEMKRLMVLLRHLEPSRHTMTPEEYISRISDLFCYKEK